MLATVKDNTDPVLGGTRTITFNDATLEDDDTYTLDCMGDNSVYILEGINIRLVNGGARITVDYGTDNGEQTFGIGAVGDAEDAGIQLVAGVSKDLNPVNNNYGQLIGRVLDDSVVINTGTVSDVLDDNGDPRAKSAVITVTIEEPSPILCSITSA